MRKAGDRVRITAQLIDAKTGGHVWADRYDRDLTDIFAIQDEISKAIVAALRVKLLPEEKKAIETRGTASVEAYNLYLMARQHWISGSFGDIRRDETIVRICKQAVSIDPNYAEAWALMALAQSQLRLWHARGCRCASGSRASAVDQSQSCRGTLRQGARTGGAGQATGSDRGGRNGAPPRPRIRGKPTARRRA